MKTKLSILFLLMFSMNISCLKEGPYISFRSKLKRLTYYEKGNSHCKWVIDKFFRDGEDVSAEVKSTDTLGFDIEFYDGKPPYIYGYADYYSSRVLYFLRQINPILARDSNFCSRNYCFGQADAFYKFIDKGRKIEYRFQTYNSPARITPEGIVATAIFRIGYEKVDNSVQQQMLIFDVLRLTHRELVLGWAYRGKYYRMEFIKKPT